MQESSMDIRATLARFAFLFDKAPTYLSAKQSRGMQAAQQHWDFVTFRKYQLFFYNNCRFLLGSLRNVIAVCRSNINVDDASA